MLDSSWHVLDSSWSRLRFVLARLRSPGSAEHKQDAEDNSFFVTTRYRVQQYSYYSCELTTHTTANGKQKRGNYVLMTEYVVVQKEILVRTTRKLLIPAPFNTSPCPHSRYPTTSITFTRYMSSAYHHAPCRVNQNILPFIRAYDH